MAVLFPRDNAGGFKDGLAQWCADRIPHVGSAGFGPCMPAAVLNPRGFMIAVIVFHDWQPLARTLQVSGASSTPRWASRANVRELYRYAFVAAGANLLWTATPLDLDRVWGFDKAIGMREEATLRHRFGPGRHAVICSMTADEWRQSRWYTGGRENGTLVSCGSAGVLLQQSSGVSVAS